MKVVPMIKLWKLKNRVHRRVVRVVRKRLGKYRCSACGNCYEGVSWTESRQIYIYKNLYVLQLLCLTDL